MSTNRNRTAQQRMAAIERAIDRLQTHQDVARHHVNHVLAQGKGLSTAANYVDALRRLEQFTDRSVFDLTPHEWTGVLARFQLRYKTSTVASSTSAYKRLIRLHLRTKELPYDLTEALAVYMPNDGFHQPTLTEDHLHSILEALRVRYGRYRLPMYEIMQTYVWVLWASGFRASEALALRVGSVQLEDGGAWLALPPDAMDLKTGPRRGPLPPSPIFAARRRQNPCVSSMAIAWATRSNSASSSH